MLPEKTKQEYIKKLCEKASELGRLPKKGDFDVDDVVKIKECFGPWPHALEAAGLIAEKNERKTAKKARHNEQN